MKHVHRFDIRAAFYQITCHIELIFLARDVQQRLAAGARVVHVHDFALYEKLNDVDLSSADGEHEGGASLHRVFVYIHINIFTFTDRLTDTLTDRHKDR
jgi:hypothetical protein